MDGIKYELKVGDWVEYSTSEWLQSTAGASPIEIIEIMSIDQEGGLSYNNQFMHGNMGSEHVKKFVTPLRNGSKITYWEWEHCDSENEFCVTLKKQVSTIASIHGSIAMIDLFNRIRIQVDLRNLLFDRKMIDYKYFKSELKNLKEME